MLQPNLGGVELTSYHADDVSENNSNSPTAGISYKDLDAILEKTIKKALVVFQDEVQKLINTKLAAIEARLTTIGEKQLQTNSDMETRLFTIDERCSHIEESFSSLVNEDLLEKELGQVRQELRDAMISHNKFEQHFRNNNIRIRGSTVKRNSDNPKETIVEMFRDKMHLHDIQPKDFEIVSILPINRDRRTRTDQTNRDEFNPAHQEHAVCIRFNDRKTKELILQKRKILKGCRIVTDEDLTSMNVKLMNRLRLDERIQNFWSWNGVIYAQLQNGNKVAAKPFITVDTLCSINNSS